MRQSLRGLALRVPECREALAEERRHVSIEEGRQRASEARVVGVRAQHAEFNTRGDLVCAEEVHPRFLGTAPLDQLGRRLPHDLLHLRGRVLAREERFHESDERDDRSGTSVTGEAELATAELELHHRPLLAELHIEDARVSRAPPRPMNARGSDLVLDGDPGIILHHAGW